jgi:membrane protease YdiL (CAAX protease family)
VQNELVPGEIVQDELALQAMFGIVAVLASLALAGPVTALARHLFPGRNVFFARWGFSHVALVVAFVLALNAAGAIALRAADVSISGLQGLVYSAALQGSVVLLVFGIARKLDPAGARSLGFGEGNNGRAVLVAFVAYLAAVPGMLGIGVVWRWVLHAIGHDPAPQDLIGLVADLSGWRLAAFSVLAVVVVPFLEEVLFRGFLQPLLVQNLGDRGGVAVTAILFAAIHVSVFAFVPLLALALVLGAVMLKTRRIVATWFLHGLHNGVTILIVLVTRGAQENPLG